MPYGQCINHTLKTDKRYISPKVSKDNRNIFRISNVRKESPSESKIYFNKSMECILSL